MGEPNSITVICGHYGCGKTNLSLNLAIDDAQKGKPVTLVDMDIVNPYFRSSEYGELLSDYNISLISPVYANTTLDTPTLPPEINAIFLQDGRSALIDAGGDDAGVIALRTLRDRIVAHGYQMIYVINRYRALSQSPQEACVLLGEIEQASGLTACGIVNNSHLGVETTKETILQGLTFAQETARLTGLPLLYSTMPDFALPLGEQPPDGFRVIKRHVLFPWEEARM